MMPDHFIGKVIQIPPLGWAKRFVLLEVIGNMPIQRRYSFVFSQVGLHYLAKMPLNQLAHLHHNQFLFIILALVTLALFCNSYNLTAFAMTKEDKSKSYSSIKLIISNSIEKFYSSRPPIHQNTQLCECVNRNAEKQEQINYYFAQKQMIAETTQTLFRQAKSEDQRIIAQLLSMFIDYINKVFQMLNKTTMCPCKEQELLEAKVTKHKMQFVREENQKFFQLLQQKNQECDALNAKLKLISQKIVQTDSDVRPITKRVDNKNKTGNSQNSLVELNSQNWSKNMRDSIQNSKISINYEAINPINTQINSVKQRDHDIYFKDELRKSYKKTKIFNQVQQNVIKKSSACLK